MSIDFEHELSNYRRKQRPKGVFRRYPVGSRAVAMLGAFLLLVPISWLLGVDRGGQKVSTRSLAGASVGAPAVNESVTSVTAAPVVSTVAVEATTTVVSVAVPVTEPATTVPPAAAAAIAVASTAPPTTARPAPTTVKAAVAPAPVATTAKPVSTTAKPVATTAKPVATTAKPASTTAKPVATTAKPVATTAKPAPTTAKPAPTTAKPVPTTAKPIPTTAKPAPTTAAKPAQAWNTGQVEQLIRQMWPAESLDKALDVAFKESNYQARAYNGSCCYGVFQIHYQSHKRRLAARGLGLEGLYDPKVNIEIALEIFQEQGWSPWTTA
jgi:Transglycosylase SLT domain